MLPAQATRKSGNGMVNLHLDDEFAGNVRLEDLVLLDGQRLRDVTLEFIDFSQRQA
jgi:hypothetical protein